MDVTNDPVATDAEEKPKRAWMPWYKLPVWPICPKCRVAFRSTSTRTQKDGLVIQHRKCPECGETFTTTYNRNSNKPL